MKKTSSRSRLQPPAGLRATSFTHGSQALVVLSYPVHPHGDDDERVLQAYGLSEAERSVALLTLHDLSDAQIAALRGTSKATVSAQLNRAYRKLGIFSRRELAAFIENSFAKD